MLRVYLLSQNDLFGLGVICLLRQAEVEIVGQEADLDRAIGCIKQLRPDAVIVETSAHILDAASVMTRILKTGTVTTVIELNQKENVLCLYRAEQRQARDVDDILKAIRDSPK